MSGRFGAVLTAMITPFHDDGSLDIDGAVTLARWLIDHGSDGLVITGTTGEAPTLTDEEDVELWRAVKEAVTVPIIAGSTTNDTRHSVELTKHAEACGVDGILTQTPYYNRPSQAGIAAHFKAVAEATSLPVILYDIPIRSGRKIEHATLLELAKVDNIVGVKDAAGDPSKTARLLAEAPSGFEVYSGDDSMTLPLLAVGAVGVICVASHWAGPVFQEMITAFFKGDVEGARAANARLMSSFAYETSDANPYPAPAKAMMRVLGLPAGPLRLPAVETDTKALEAAARAIIDELGITLG